jgi:hypothetical protein
MPSMPASAIPVRSIVEATVLRSTLHCRRPVGFERSDAAVAAFFAYLVGLDSPLPAISVTGPKHYFASRALASLEKRAAYYPDGRASQRPRDA